MSRNEQDRTKVADPEVVPTAMRRQFSNAEKLRILEEADACTEPGEIGALLRREGCQRDILVVSEPVAASSGWWATGGSESQETRAEAAGEQRDGRRGERTAA
jgi:hypothetical protein